ncbi:hypothetical protein [Bacillus cereus]|uniref:Uncharacterized protein n=1 Tax=Bacillus cereus 03BB108 TaxID=451709 RepID=A0AAN0SS97_BACCE|nr:hypothetical protein [Bacillus cereus]AJI08768.1 hypothetical protein AK40_5595 [Bacillus cereus 03BB108]EDX59994.1 hypothetical protein BC03BB108_B0241 [Bacillus cereus 03BB108]QKG99084.1 hypothetical protein FOC96_02185 [Bacillus cereus]
MKKKRLLIFFVIVVCLIGVGMFVWKWDEWEVKNVVERNITALSEQDHKAFTETLTQTVQDNTSANSAAALLLDKGRAKFSIKEIKAEKVNRSNWLVKTKQQIKGNVKIEGKEELNRNVNINYHVVKTDKGWKISWYELSKETS